MNAILIAALARARMAAKPVRKSAWSDDHRNPHTYAPHDAITREGARALATEGFLLQLSAWREEKTDGGLLLVADMGLWHASSGLWWPMTPWKEPLEGGSDRGKAWHAAQVAARAYAHREVCSLEVLDESRAAGLPLLPKEEAPAPVDGLSQEDRDAFAKAVNAPTEEEERELRKAETEAKLRSVAPPPPPPAPTNGTTPHIEAEPAMPPTPRASIAAVLPPCPICRAAAYIEKLCASCGRTVCTKCTTGPLAIGPCVDCNTAEENADCAPPHLSDEACEAARRMLDDGRPRAYVLAAASVEVLGSGPLGLLLKFDGAVFRLDGEQLERWLRGDLTVGVEDDEEGEEEGVGSRQPASDPPAPSTSLGAGSPKGETEAASVAPVQPTASSTSPDADPQPKPTEGPDASSGASTSASRPPEETQPSSQAASSGGGDLRRCDGCSRLRSDLVSTVPGRGREPRMWCADCRAADDVAPPVLTAEQVAKATAVLDADGSTRAALEAIGAKILASPKAEHDARFSYGGPGNLHALGEARWWAKAPAVNRWLLGGLTDQEYEARLERLIREAQEPAELVQPSPKLLTACDAIAATTEASFKALGKEWAAFKSHMAQKKPAGSCALCPHQIPTGQRYYTGRGKKWTKKVAHYSCVAKLLEGRDPTVNERHELEREAIDRLTPAVVAGEA